MPPRPIASLLAACLIGCWAAPTTASAQGMIFIVRHAEKSTSPAADPRLSAEGEQRAESLKALLAGSGITTIVTSKATRTKQTAGPLATAAGITPVIDAMDDAGALARRLRAALAGGNVLVVGHSNTIPDLLEAMGHPAKIDIDDDEFDNLFIVVPTGERPLVTRLRYKR